jgi:hypothetical protein
MIQDFATLKNVTSDAPRHKYSPTISRTLSGCREVFYCAKIQSPRVRFFETWEALHRRLRKLGSFIPAGGSAAPLLAPLLSSLTF